MFVISPTQCRAARAILNWSQPDLAQRCGMHVQTISNFEHESGTPTKRTLQKIMQTLEMAGIDFIENDGVRRKDEGHIRILKGKDGFKNFRYEVYNVAKNTNQEICVSNVDERLFARWDTIQDEYMRKMSSIKNLDFRILIKDGDDFLLASEYAEYRWVPPEHFTTVPFYVYGDNLALMIFEENEVTIYIINNKKIADAQRTHFNIVWKQAGRAGSNEHASTA